MIKKPGMKFTSTLHPISWFRDHYLNERLEIKPPFQRRPVWTPKQKCYLIETILLNLPIPEIYVQRSVTADGEETFAIVDGQQRVRSVLRFIGSETDEEERNSTDSLWTSLIPHRNGSDGPLQT